MEPHAERQYEPGSHDEVFCEYGRTMWAAQDFEDSVRRVALQASPELQELADSGGDFSELWNQFRTRPARKMALRVPDDELLEKLDTAVNVRNTLAHNYFWLYVIRLHSGGLSPTGAVEELKRVARKFRSLTEKLGDLFEQLTRAQGVRREELADVKVEFRGFEGLDLWPDRDDEETVGP